MGKIITKDWRIFIVFLFLLEITVSVHAQKTVLPLAPPKRIAVNAGYQYNLAAADSAGNPITYSCKIPAWMRLDTLKKTLSGKAPKAGQYPIRISATTKDTIIRQQFMLTVYDQHTTNIWAIGNSITNGTGVYNSYRRQLWQLLHAAHYNVDFVGSWDKHHMGGNVPDPDFDMDHDGHSGWTTHQILEPPDWDKHRGNIDQWLEEISPDIVLIELGTNDVFQCVPIPAAMNDLSVMIDKLRAKNNKVRILVAQIPPLGDQWAEKKLCGTDTAYGAVVKMFNAAVAGMARMKGTDLSPVVIVDQFTGVDPAVDMYDDIHPNEKGEKKMAERWFKAMKPFLGK
ncbi:MAG: hypothetical protein EOO01_21315 [Chitinophagaceae bacterium]|nr:MAG: hypothetical protein EOO01_21315 [Chitinophagaceae bacterium]